MGNNGSGRQIAGWRRRFSNLGVAFSCASPPFLLGERRWFRLDHLASRKESEIETLREITLSKKTSFVLWASFFVR